MAVGRAKSLCRPVWDNGRGLQPSLAKAKRREASARRCAAARQLSTARGEIGAFKAGSALLYASLARALFPGSSAVEQPAVNRLVAGSNPARGAK